MKRFRVEVISQTPSPQRTIYGAMHQDYSEDFVYDHMETWPDEQVAGGIIVKNLLKGDRGHYGPFEHPQIVFNCGWFPHSTMQQVRTHRVGVSFDVQSGRYTGKRVLDVVNGKRAIDEVFYFRPVGEYHDRQGAKYTYSQSMLQADKDYCRLAAEKYRLRLTQGFSEEHARDMLPYCIRQHWYLSANGRSLMHLLDLRWKKDAQLEAQKLCDLIFPHFKHWMPQVAQWYEENRAHKARLAP